jgi:hypothetical protein
MRSIPLAFFAVAIAASPAHGEQSCLDTGRALSDFSRKIKHVTNRIIVINCLDGSYIDTASGKTTTGEQFDKLEPTRRAIIYPGRDFDPNAFRASDDTWCLAYGNSHTTTVACWAFQFSKNSKGRIKVIKSELRIIT